MTVMTWTQPICQSCWDKRNPDRPAVHVVSCSPETCCFCGEPATAGIYLRVDPSTVPYPSEDEG